VFSACEKEKIEPIDMPVGLYAIWIENGYDDDISIFEKSGEFDENKYGFQLISNGKFIERKNSGWCATPPIIYENYEGKWSKLSDSLINVETTYRGGTMVFDMEIVSMNQNELKVRYHYKN
jgi:hypothetical protein